MAKREPWPIIVTRKGRNFYGFENKCPHAGERLDVNSGEFMDEAGNFLICSHHGAQFDLDTGYCFSGPCQDKSLTAIKIVVDDGDVCITGVELAEEDGLDLDDTDAPRSDDHRRLIFTIRITSRERRMTDMAELVKRKKAINIAVVFADPDAFVDNYLGWLEITAFISALRAGEVRRRPME